MIIDSHCHLNMLDPEKYAGDISYLIKKAAEQGVEHILCVGVDLENSKEAVAIAEQYDSVSASIGLHPSEARDYVITHEELIELANHPKVIAIGETGLDYHYNKDNLEGMRQRFRTHIQAAREIKKPIIVHTRDAREDTIAILKEEKAHECGGVMHCFTESWEMAEQALEIGFYISFSGIVTFKNAKEVAEVASRVPLERILIETDAPYLTPAPYRGKPNEPQFVRFVAEKIAELKDVTFDEVAKATTQNFYDLFKVE